MANMCGTGDPAIVGHFRMSLVLANVGAPGLDGARGRLVELDLCSKVGILFVDDTTCLTDKAAFVRY